MEDIAFATLPWDKQMAESSCRQLWGAAFNHARKPETDWAVQVEKENTALPNATF